MRTASLYRASGASNALRQQKRQQAAALESAALRTPSPRSRSKRQDGRARQPNGQNDTDERVPVTVLIGYLRAKTTLLNRILTEKQDTNTWVIVNEFGELGSMTIGAEGQCEEDIFEMNNGCICCTVRATRELK